MTHHDLDKEKAKRVEDQAVIGEAAPVVAGTLIGADQNIDITEEGKGTTKKGKKGNKKGKKDKKQPGGRVRETVADVATCGGCANLMTQSSSMNWRNLTEEKGLYLPKKYRSAPGAAAGSASAPMCDNCEQGIPVKREPITVVGILAESGKVYNIAVTDLVTKREKEKDNE